MFVISKKTALGAAIAAAFGAAALAGPVQAKVMQVNPKMKRLYLYCGAGFAKSPNRGDRYYCTRYFTVACKPRFGPGQPVVRKVGRRRYRIRYTCFQIPR
jgi:hypothetical protein